MIHRVSSLLLSLLLVLLISSCKDDNLPTIEPLVEDTVPSVSIKVDEVTATTIKATFTPNRFCPKYYVMVVDTTALSKIEQGDKTLSELVEEFGIKYTETVTHTFSQGINPGTTWYVVALPINKNYHLVKEIVTTPTVGGEGASVITVEVTDITNDAAKVTATPNAETSKYYYGLISKQDFDQYADINAAWESVFEGVSMFPLTDKDTWTYNVLGADKEWVVLARGKNKSDEWGQIARKDFRTLPNGGTPQGAVSKISLSVYDVTKDEATVLSTPNEHTDMYWTTVVYKELADSLGFEGVFSLLAQQLGVEELPEGFATQGVDEFRWGGLDSDVDQIVIARGKNKQGEWGEFSSKVFHTLPQ